MFLLCCRSVDCLIRVSTVFRVYRLNGLGPSGIHSQGISMKWNSYKGGQRWARLESGAIASDSPPVPAFASIVREPGVVEYRTKGDPSTAWAALQDYGSAMRAASLRFNVPVPVIFGMMAIEATRQGADRSHFNPRSLRLEPGYVSDEKTPNKVSPGLMQTLISTAREANVKSGLYWDFDRNLERITREDLFIPERSIMLGAAYMRYQINRKEPDEAGFDDDDPVLLCSAYNAGSVRETSSNPWRLLTYGADRMDKFIAYHNDMVAVLAGVPVWIDTAKLPRVAK